MKNKILLAIIALVIIVGGILGYSYYANDAFKSDKEIFLSYLTEEDSTNLTDKMQQYLDKRETKSYTNKGNATLTIDGAANDQSIQLLNNAKITFDGKMNKPEKI